MSYRYIDACPKHSHAYLLPVVLPIVEDFLLQSRERRIFDLGCGNGSATQRFAECDAEVTGVDPSEDGIGYARIAYKGVRFELGSAYDDLAATFGRFPVVVSLEVVEHLYAPRVFAKTVFDLLTPGGHAIISTPFHGYWKNLALAVTGKMDSHFTALWDHGHIKFWSERTLTALLSEAGFSEVCFHRVGRVPPFAKSMIAIATKPRSPRSPT